MAERGSFCGPARSSGSSAWFKVSSSGLQDFRVYGFEGLGLKGLGCKGSRLQHLIQVSFLVFCILITSNKGFVEHVFHQKSEISKLSIPKLMFDM